MVDAPLCNSLYLFLYFLCHPYILAIFVENFYYFFILVAACQLDSYVSNCSERFVIRDFCGDMQILSMVEHVFGKRFIEDAVRGSVFQQFAGGEDEQSVLRTMHQLAAKDVNSILFYSAEQDIEG